jgi:undecaprenyl diphosphate synthase
MKNNVVFKTIGETWRLPEHVQKIIREAEERTASNNGMTLITALSYSGRNEIMRAVKKILQSDINPHDLSEDTLNAYLDTAGLPNPDLIIRTSGEMRMSNFLLWQGAYSELYFTDTLWPDFTKEELLLAIQDYQRRERRFGKIPVRSNAP